MEHSEEADVCAQMFGIGGDRSQGFCSSPEEDAIHQILVLISDGGDIFRHSKDNVEVFAVQNFGFSFFDPLGASERLALGTVPVAAAVVAGSFVRTGVTSFEMAAECCRSTHLDRGHDTPLRSGERRTMLTTIGFTIAAKDVRHFQLGAIHPSQRLEMLRWGGFGLHANRTRQQIERARCRAHFAGCDLEIFCSRRQTAMTK